MSMPFRVLGRLHLLSATGAQHVHGPPLSTAPPAERSRLLRHVGINISWSVYFRKLRTRHIPLSAAPGNCPTSSRATRQQAAANAVDPADAYRLNLKSNRGLTSCSLVSATLGAREPAPEKTSRLSGKVSEDGDAPPMAAASSAHISGLRQFAFRWSRRTTDQRRAPAPGSAVLCHRLWVFRPPPACVEAGVPDL